METACVRVYDIEKSKPRCQAASLAAAATLESRIKALSYLLVSLLGNILLRHQVFGFTYIYTHVFTHTVCVCAC